MKYIISGQSAKKIDEKSINKYEIPSLVLMERAALLLVDEIKRIPDFEKSLMYRKIVVFAGGGNNGADGLAVSRILLENKIDSKIFVLGKVEKATEEFKTQAKILKNHEKSITYIDENNINEIEISKNDIVIDGIFGIGLKREVSGVFKTVIDKINKIKPYVIAIDIPSGLSADSGKVLGVAVKADKTVTFGYEKLGLYIVDGRDYTGEIISKNVGFSRKAMDEVIEEDDVYLALEKNDILNIPSRKNTSNKGTYKNVCIISGNENMSGAAAFCGIAAYRCGAGIVKIYSHSNNLSFLRNKVPEAIISDYSKEFTFSDKDIIVIGPGIGRDDNAFSLIEKALNSNCRMVIDADGLNIISEHRELLDKFSENIIITPHVLEMARLCGKTAAEVKNNIVNVAKEFAKKYKCVTVVKDSTSVIANADGPTYLNLSGNSGMSTGGSGDVLAGIIGGMLSQGMSMSDAAAMGVYLHGLSGDYAKNEKTMYGLMASDIANAIPEVLKQANKNS